jgi:hypothetical protein
VEEEEEAARRPSATAVWAARIRSAVLWMSLRVSSRRFRMSLRRVCSRRRRRRRQGGGRQAAVAMSSSRRGCEVGSGGRRHGWRGCGGRAHPRCRRRRRILRVAAAAVVDAQQQPPPAILAPRAGPRSIDIIIIIVVIVIIPRGHSSSFFVALLGTPASKTQPTHRGLDSGEFFFLTQARKRVNPADGFIFIVDL